MNLHFSYENFDLWQKGKWDSKMSPIRPLIAWIGETGTMQPCDTYVEPVCDDPRQLPYFQRKSGSVDDPNVFAFWSDQGMNLKTLEMGAYYWLRMIPEKALANPDQKIPVLLVINRGDYSDPYWAMKLVTQYADYYEAAAREQFMVIHVLCENSDVQESYGNILQEALVLYPGDSEQIFLDISSVRENGSKLSSIPGFSYTDAQGNPADPDCCQQALGGIPVLDISGRWANADSLNRTLAMDAKANDMGEAYNRNWLIHTETGRRLMEGISLEYTYADLHAADQDGYWTRMGLVFKSEDYKGQRWTTFSPQPCFSEPENKLPLFIVMQEMHIGNEHLPLNGYGAFYQVIKIAA
jgi:hypothetical protein